ncbi:MAG: cupin domain-containing protein [Planctomycetota bacterium]|nr:cupin domain-containing protein [Planctomycetota bacterium]
MRFSRMKSHPDFAVEGRSQHFHGCFEMELTPGEETLTLQNAKHEELIYLLSGRAIITMERKESELGSGDLILIPAQKWRKITNPSKSTTRLISFASSPQIDNDHPDEEPKSLENLDTLLNSLPETVQEIDAIQSIIKLFDIGGQLTEQIERCVGLNNDTGLQALIALQKRLMKAVLNITNRYKTSKQQP